MTLRGGQLRLIALTALASVLALPACTSSGEPDADSSRAADPTSSGISAWGIVGAPLDQFACPDATEVMKGKFNSIENYESIEGTVIAYTFCRTGWFSTPEPDRHLDMSDPQLVADVTAALAQPDQTVSAAPNCPNDPPRWELPVIVKTTEGTWFVHQPLLPCGQDPLYPVADQLSSLEEASGTLTGIVRMYGGPPDPTTGKPALRGSPGRNRSVKVLSGSQVVAATTSDDKGHFSVALPPGTYRLECMHPTPVVVKAGIATEAVCKVAVR